MLLHFCDTKHDFFIIGTIYNVNINHSTTIKKPKSMKIQALQLFRVTDEIQKDRKLSYWES